MKGGAWRGMGAMEKIQCRGTRWHATQLCMVEVGAAMVAHERCMVAAGAVSVHGNSSPQMQHWGRTPKHMNR